MRNVFLLPIIAILSCCQQHPRYDIIIRNSIVYDGTGSAPINGDVGIIADTVAFIGNLSSAEGGKEIDATGLAVSPGFINMLSMGDRSLLLDGRSLSDIKQGVTLEIFGEGWSPGPVKRNGKQTADSLWTTLDDYLQHLTKKGVSPNVASFVGHTTVRNYVLGYANRAATPEELEQMKQLVQQAMEDGALGLGASLIYAPATFAPTEELIELSKIAAAYKGIYISHMRSESDFILVALHETFRIAQEANIPAEIYHLKINHERNWRKIDTVLYKIDSAQRAGLSITANMYPYAASNTSLLSRLPAWVQEGGAKEMRKKLRAPSIRKKVLHEMRMGIPSKNSDPTDVMVLGFKLDSLNQLYRGKRLDEVARMHGKDADETLIDLLLEDKSPAAGVYFLISEENMKRMLSLPFVSIGSDGASLNTETALKDFGMVHPRTYGTFAKVLGPCVRDYKLFTLQEAVHRMSGLPASRLHLHKRGELKVGHYADVVVFNPHTIQDHATFTNPNQYATGVEHVMINGKMVIENKQHTNATPGRIVYGIGRTKK
jgi:N-acyl-D-amino-acid deacylase